MNIRITSCRKDTFWYSNKIGQIFPIHHTTKDAYYVDEARGVHPSDCVLTEQPYVEDKSYPHLYQRHLESKAQLEAFEKMSVEEKEKIRFDKREKVSIIKESRDSGNDKPDESEMF